MNIRIKSQKGGTTAVAIAQIVIGLLGLFILYQVISNSFREYSKEDLTEYNQWVAECNSTVTSNQLIVAKYPQLMSGITFKQLKSIPLNSDNKTITKYKNENQSAYEHNNQQADLVNEIIMRYNLMVTFLK